jgi:hypothetical protein
MIAYKLFTKRKNGTIGSLFINRRAVLKPSQWLVAEDHRTDGFSHRPGWHCTARPEAPHLKADGRVWYQVEIEDYTTFKRPQSQGGKWLLANKLKIIKPLEI